MKYFGTDGIRGQANSKNINVDICRRRTHFNETPLL